MNFSPRLKRIRVANTDVELFVPDDKEIQAAYANGQISFPYWSQIWPASIALAEFIITHRGLVENKKLLELGAGLGLPSLVAAKYASSVLCSDKEPEAIKLAARSGAHNQLDNLEVQVIDWNLLSPDIQADILLLSDVNYEPEAFSDLSKILFHLLENRVTILLATPQRLMAKSFIEPLMKFAVQRSEIVVEHKLIKVTISLLVFEM